MSHSRYGTPLWRGDYLLIRTLVEVRLVEVRLSERTKRKMESVIGLDDEREFTGS